MKEVIVQTRVLNALSIQTNLANEMNPNTAKIGSLWQKFDAEVPVDYQHGERVYGLYSNYENGVEGNFTATAAYDGKSLDFLNEVTIEAGKYLLFEAEASSSDDNARGATVMALWGEVWAYFGGNPKHIRAFLTDFDFYKDATHIEVYVSIL